MYTTSARLYLTFRMFQLSLFVVSVMNLEKVQRFFLCFSSKQQEYYQEYWIGSKHLRPTLFKFFSCFVLYFQSHFMMLPFYGLFYCFSHQLSNSNKFKDFKAFKYYCIRIETCELTTVENWRMKKLDPNTRVRITWVQLYLSVLSPNVGKKTDQKNSKYRHFSHSVSLVRRDKRSKM